MIIHILLDFIQWNVNWKFVISSLSSKLGVKTYYISRVSRAWRQVRDKYKVVVTLCFDLF